MSEWDKELAMFVVYIGVQPSEYFKLTINQRSEIIKAWNTKQRQSRRK